MSFALQMALDLLYWVHLLPSYPLTVLTAMPTGILFEAFLLLLQEAWWLSEESECVPGKGALPCQRPQTGSVAGREQFAGHQAGPEKPAEQNWEKKQEGAQPPFL